MEATKSKKREKLEREIRQKMERLKDLNAQERVKERKRETRKKIVAGEIALQHMDINDNFKTTLNMLLNKHVTRPNDRDLFSLRPVENNDEQGAH